MTKSQRRNADLGFAAWSRGDCDRAVELLAPLAATGDGAVEVICPLARAYSDRGDREKALSTLASAVAKGVEPARLVRAEVLFDHGPTGDAEKALEALGAANPIAAGLLALLELSRAKTNGKSLALPRAARWMASVMGRLLALLEARLLSTGAEAFAAYHVRSLLPEGSPGADPIDQALGASDFKEVIRICRRDAAAAPPTGQPGRFRLRLRRMFGRAQGYPPVYRQWMIGFAQTLLGEEQEAETTIAAALQERDSRLDFLLLSGLHRARFGRRSEASAMFSCAARTSDVVVSDNIEALAKHLGIPLQLRDS